MPKLDNAKYEAFCQEYIIDFNGAQAAIRAGYSKKTARTQASKLLTITDIMDRVGELTQERSKATGITAQYVLDRVVEIDQLDVLDILNDDLTGFKSLKEWPKSWRTSISGIDLSEIFAFNAETEARELSGILKKIKWPDKTKNLELIGKHVDVEAFMNKHRVETSEPIHFNMNFGDGK